MISKLFTKNEYIPAQDGIITFSLENIAVINEMNGPIGEINIEFFEDYFYTISGAFFNPDPIEPLTMNFSSIAFFSSA